MSFVHLHVHSEYSLLDGLGHPHQIVARAKELHQPAVALTDHGVMYGVIDFYNAAKKAGIKPIVGMEGYLARRSRHDRDPQKDKSPYHLLLLAQTEAGYKNLLQLATLAQLEGFYYKPRVDREILERHAPGLIVTTGCGSSEVPRLIQNGQIDQARAAVAWYAEVFGRDRFFIELQLHDGIPELVPINKQLLAFAREFGLKAVATNDVHFIRAENARAQDVLLCIGTGSLVSEPNRMKMTDASYYLKSAEEMAALFGEIPEALSNTLLVAEMCEVDLGSKGYHLPEFPVPDGYTPEAYLRQLCEAGLVKRYGDRASDPVIRQRLDYELSVIHQMGFDTYFLIVGDLTRYAGERNIWWNVRGSAAGSIVAYTAGITLLDPLAHGLIFERFLNPGRISMPDIDLDFPDDRRAEMIEYAVRKYGRDMVAQIITFGTLGARAAIRDVGRAMDIPLNDVDRIAKLVPAIPGKPITIRDAIEQVPELKQEFASTEYVRELLDAAVEVEGTARNVGTHAAGVIISDKPLVEYAPLHRPTKSDKSETESSLEAITQFEMGVCEAIGLLKVDFLGLSTLTIMRKACDLIEQRHGVKWTLENIPTDEPAAFELMARGDVSGLFQVEGEGMRRVLTEMKPTKFEHIVAAISLFRPGPIEYIPTYIKRLHGEEPVTYKHPALEPILADTYAIIIYQEQIIQIAVQLAGYTPGEADEIRKAVGKKIKEKIEAHREKFVKGAVHNGIPEPTAKAIYDDIEYFARYGFNKAHGADYAVITCQTAFLKARYPVEYMTALMTVERGNTEKVGFLIVEARRMGIEVLPPDVTRSQLDFAIEPTDHGDAIRFGLGAIKNVGEGPVRAILSARESGPPALATESRGFKNLDDFCRRVDLRQVNRRALEALIKVGAFGAFGSRAQLLASIDKMLGSSSTAHRAADVGQMSLFGALAADDSLSTLGTLPAIDEAPLRERLEWEKELIGVYVSEHPVARALTEARDVITHLSTDITEDLHEHKITLLGLVQSWRTTQTKKGDTMAFVTLEDVQGTIDVVVFPRTWKQTQGLWQRDKILLVSGKIDAHGRKPSIICDTVRDNWVRPADAPRVSEPRAAYQPQRPRPQPYVPPPPPPAEWDEPDIDAPAMDVEPPPAAETEPIVGHPLQNGGGSISRHPRPSLRAAAGGEAIPPSEGSLRRSAPREDVAAPSEPITETIAPVQPAPVRETAALPPAPVPSAPRPLPPAAPRFGTPRAGFADRSAPRAPGHLRVMIARTGNGHQDAKRLGDAHRLLQSYHGQDKFSFYVTGGDNGTFEVDFPNDTTQICDELLTRLRGLFGPQSIQMID